MDEIIKKILDDIGEIDPLKLARVLAALGREEPEEVIFNEDVDSFGKIYIATCPNCGENLRFERYSQVVLPYSYCYRCGKKLKKIVQSNKNKEE